MITCKNGHENPEGAIFCKECGDPLNETVSANVLSFKRTFCKWHPVTKVSFYVIVVAVLLLIMSVILGNHFKKKEWDTEAKYIYKLSITIKAINHVDGFWNYRLEKIKEELYEHWDDIYYFGDIPSYIKGGEALVKQISATDYNTLKGLQSKYFHYHNLLYIFNIDYEGVLTIMFLIALITGVLSFIWFFIAYNLRWKKFELQHPFPDAKKALKQYAFSHNSTGEHIRIKENSRGELLLYDKDGGRRAHFHLVQNKNGKVELIGEKYNSQSLIRKVFGKDLNFIEN